MAKIFLEFIIISIKAYEISQKRRQLESLAQHMINANANNTQISGLIYTSHQV